MTALVNKGSSFFPAKTGRAYERYDVNTCEGNAARSSNDYASVSSKTQNYGKQLQVRKAISLEWARISSNKRSSS
eukprot:4742854-Pleurochrysis_carterae.AAC.1